MDTKFLKKLTVDVIDQHGEIQAVEAMYDTSRQKENLKANDDQIRYLNVNDELIKPSFDMHFFSIRTGKIFKFA